MSGGFDDTAERYFYLPSYYADDVWYILQLGVRCDVFNGNLRHSFYFQG